MSTDVSKRRAGVTLPLFSLRTKASWGIGEFTDLPAFAAWMKRDAGVDLVQVLPLGEISGGETSPYSALAAFGFDPMYIAPSALEDLNGHEREALGDDGLALLDSVKGRARVDYAAVRALKQRALGHAFRRFLGLEVARSTMRAQRFFAFVDAERAWLDDYALYRAVKDASAGRPWWGFAPGVPERDSDVLERARVDLGTDVLFYDYAQWIAHEQWSDSRAKLAAMGVEVMGDLPFMVARDSVDVWAHRSGFKAEGSVGAPPDAYSDEGQDWDLPPYDWTAMQRDGFAWLRARARYMARIFHLFRIDHLIGFYRTYQRPRDEKFDAKGRLAPGVFDPSDEKEQLAHGERVLSAMLAGAKEGGGSVIAEDLGLIPEWVRASLTKLGVPGYKVLAWEKDGDVFRDPHLFPKNSVVCFGTHDAPPLAAWWNGLEKAERANFLALPSLAPRARALDVPFNDAVHAALFELLAEAGSDLALVSYQDMTGSLDRINIPGTTGAHNWTYRLPAAIDELAAHAPTRERLAVTRAAFARAHRVR